MQVADNAVAIHYLNFIGYYRLSGYFRALTDPADASREKFRAGISFQDALDLYIFDRKLRVLLTDAHERIEVAVKAAISNSAALTWRSSPTMVACTVTFRAPTVDPPAIKTAVAWSLPSGGPSHLVNIPKSRNNAEAGGEGDQGNRWSFAHCCSGDPTVVPQRSRALGSGQRLPPRRTRFPGAKRIVIIVR